MGIGSKIILVSIRTLMMLVQIMLSIKEPQVPGNKGFHDLASGRQMRKVSSTTARQNKLVRPMMVKVIRRKDLLGRNRVR